MPNFTAKLPLSLYVHLPWCVKKCPYCDFNSHALKGELPEADYCQALLTNLDEQLAFVAGRPILSIFFGGGTPSLFSPASFAHLLDGIAKRLAFANAIEITLEANPGTIDIVKFEGFYQAGINRLSLGVQSFQDAQLKRLGRIHDSATAKRAIDSAIHAGFTNFNIDLMHGLPQQRVTDALHDIETALSFAPTHLSWYQLTLEPNTLFYHQPPELPDEDTLADIQTHGIARLQNETFQQYEVSAYARHQQYAAHNLNYWQFGDYLGIGAGAHSKMTSLSAQQVYRFAMPRHPKDFMQAEKRQAVVPQVVSERDLVFEFMLNALRLVDGFDKDLFSRHTGLATSDLEKPLNKAINKGLLHLTDQRIFPTTLGRQYLNDVIALFLPE